MKPNSAQVEYDVTPSPLEMHDGKVGVKITGSFPAEYFDKDAKLVLTPVLKYQAGETPLMPITLQGENFKDNNPVISFDAGGSLPPYSDTIKYSEEMRVSELELRTRATRKGETVDFEPVKLADGIITTSELVKYAFEVDADNTESAKELKGKPALLGVTLAATSTSYYDADIHFVIQRSNVRGSELRSDDVQQLLKDVETAQEKELLYKGLEISSYASPDGPLDLNTRLSQQRAESAENAIMRLLRRANLTSVTNPDMIKKETTAEDWEGFKEELEKSELPQNEKELIKRVLSMYDDPVVREREIKNIAAAYESLKTKVLPQLRRSKLYVKYETKRKTDEEIMTLAQGEEPELLSETELLYAASLKDDTDEKIEIYKTYTATYPEDWRGYNNLGVMYLQKMQLDEAKTAIEKANSIQKNEFTLNNLGVIQLTNGEFATAESYFNDALTMGEGASQEINYNLGYINLQQANYNAAERYLGNSCTFGTALAQLLNDNTDKAMKTLECTKDVDHAVFYYLKAIVHARQDDPDSAIDNLRTALKKDPSLKEYAKNDIEFQNMFENPDFKEAVN